MQPTLELLRDTFESFIAQGGTRKAISKKIKCMAVALLEFYSHAQVASALGVSDRTIYNWEKSLPPKLTDTNPQFVELPPMLDPICQPHISCLTLTLPQGIRLLIPYQSYEQISQLISLLTKE